MGYGLKTILGANWEVVYWGSGMQKGYWVGLFARKKSGKAGGLEGSGLIQLGPAPGDRGGVRRDEGSLGGLPLFIMWVKKKPLTFSAKGVVVWVEARLWTIQESSGPPATSHS